ncbi:ash family protein [Salmonella enterica]|nr:ash family protein [Salmonella enterica]EFP4633996.1 ash family protein [Salmonella enterica]EFS0362456.1 ash family protein [Salmonella enterica]EGK1504766.1 ash family protein [Salmonella enterica]
MAAQCAFALFLCRAHGYASMVGRAGASQDAPVPTKAGSSNPVRFHRQ